MNEITLTGYHGINNRLDRDRIKGLPTREDPLVEASAAVNVDFDDSGKPSLRPGFTLAGSYAGVHSGFSADGHGYCVRYGVLYEFTTGGFVPLLTLGSDATVRYCTGAGRVFFTNGIATGEIRDGAAALFGTTTVPFKATLPGGQCIGHHKSRLYVGKDSVLWISDVKPLARVDLRHGFKQFPDPIRFIAPGPEGIYVGTEKAVFYAPGGNPLKMPFGKVHDSGGKNIRVQSLDASKVKGLQIEGVFPVFATDDSVFMGLPQGQMVDLLDERYVMPSGTTGGSMIREINGQVHYIAAYR